MRSKGLLNSVFFKPMISSQFHLPRFLSYLVFFGCGLTVGVILSFYLNNLSLSLNISQLPPPSAPQQPLLCHHHPAEAANESLPLTTPPVGLKDYLKPPDVRHGMDDRELLWRASMAPRIREYPFDRVPKIAFLFLVTGPIPLAPLWERFLKGHEGMYTIYVHSSPSWSGSDPAGSVFYGRRIPSQEVQWGNVNMVGAERRLLANALLDISNQWFVLLSESCIPLFNFPTVYSYLMSSTKTFVEVLDIPGPVGHGRYSPNMYPEISLSDWRKGSQWFQIDRDLAVEVVSDTKYFPVFQKFCKDSCYADEHYLPTLMNIRFGERNSNRTLTWVDWSKGGPHPNRFIRPSVHPGFLEMLRSGSQCEYNRNTTTVCFLFARKFLPNALDRLLRFAPKIMRFNR